MAIVINGSDIPTQIITDTNNFVTTDVSDLTIPEVIIDGSEENVDTQLLPTITYALSELSLEQYAKLGYGVLGSMKVGAAPSELNYTTRLFGKVDGIDALKQSIYLMFNIEADKFIIFPYTYGFTSLDLIGKPHPYVTAILPDRITQTLMHDDRVLDVTDFEFEITEKKRLHTTFIVHSIYGNFTEEVVVTV